MTNTLGSIFQFLVDQLIPTRTVIFAMWMVILLTSTIDVKDVDDGGSEFIDGGVSMEEGKLQSDIVKCYS